MIRTALHADIDVGVARGTRRGSYLGCIFEAVSGVLRRSSGDLLLAVRLHTEETWIAVYQISVSRKPAKTLPHAKNSKLGETVSDHALQTTKRHSHGVQNIIHPTKKSASLFMNRTRYVRDAPSIPHADTPPRIRMTAVPVSRSQHDPKQREPNVQLFHARRSRRVVPLSDEFGLLCLFVDPYHCVCLKGASVASSRRRGKTYGVLNHVPLPQVSAASTERNSVTHSKVLWPRLWIPHLTCQQRMRVESLGKHRRIEVG